MGGNIEAIIVDGVSMTRKDIHNNQISYRIGYRRGKTSAVNAVCEYLKQQDENCCHELSMILGWDFLDRLKKEIKKK